MLDGGRDIKIKKIQQRSSTPYHGTILGNTHTNENSFELISNSNKF